jgi:hypothetical protein
LGPEALYRPTRFGCSARRSREEIAAAMPAEYVDAFFSFFVDGAVDETTVLPAVREVLGREPGGLAANVEAFRLTALQCCSRRR